MRCFANVANCNLQYKMQYILNSDIYSYPTFGEYSLRNVLCISLFDEFLITIMTLNQ